MSIKKLRVLKASHFPLFLVSIYLVKDVGYADVLKKQSLCVFKIFPLSTKRAYGHSSSWRARSSIFVESKGLGTKFCLKCYCHSPVTLSQ